MLPIDYYLKLPHFNELEQILKFIYNHKRPKISQSNLEKEQTWGYHTT